MNTPSDKRLDEERKRHERDLTSHLERFANKPTALVVTTTSRTAHPGPPPPPQPATTRPAPAPGPSRRSLSGARVAALVIVPLLAIGGFFLLRSSSNDETDSAISSGPLFPFEDNGRTGLMAIDGTIVVAADFDTVREFAEGLAPALRDGSWGYINHTGRFVIAPRFDDAFSFFEGRARIVKDGTYGFCKKDGVLLDGSFEDARDISQGRAAVKKHGLWGYIDSTGAEVIAYGFKYAYSFAEGFAICIPNSKQGTESRVFVDRSGRTVLRGDLAFGSDIVRAYQFNGGFAPVKLERSRCWGVTNTAGKLVVRDAYRDMYNFREGLAPFQAENGLWGCLTPNGTVAIEPQFLEVQSFREGRAGVAMRDASSGAKLWGYIDTRGELIIPGSYTRVSAFRNGLAAVERGRDRFYVDLTGRKVAPKR